MLLKPADTNLPAAKTALVLFLIIIWRVTTALQNRQKRTGIFFSHVFFLAKTFRARTFYSSKVQPFAEILQIAVPFAMM
jgi:hypothetical protein